MVLKDIAQELFPPDIPRLARWRLAMFACVMMMLFHVAWACGWLAYLGLGGGFAYASETRTLQEDIRRLRQSTLEQNLFDIHMKRCEAPTGTPVRRFLTEKIQTLQNEYRSLAGQNYALPACTDL